MPKRSDLKLTKRTVDALDVDRKDAIFWDRELAGFGVRVHATGRKTWVVQSRGPSGPKRVTLGRHGELACEEARKQAAHLIDRIRRGEEPVPPPHETEPTVAGLAERFMRTHVKRRLKPASVAAYRTLLEGHILPALGGMGLEEVGGAEAAALHHGLRDTPVLANRAVHLLSRMFTLAEAWELVPPGRNPCRAVRRYRTRKRERFLAPEEYRRLGRALRWACAEGGIWPPAIAAVRLLVLTGCRRGEILSLGWDDVDRTAGDLRLRDAKAGPRMVPLTRPVLRILDAIPRSPENPWVIAGQRPGKRLTGLHHYWRPIRERAGLSDVRLHDLRHSYASRALALGESLYTIGKLLGHTSVATSARYAHLMREAEREAAVRVGGSIGAHVANGRTA
ncbi:MAG: tyrosine-type recombinase/integrase [Nitrospinae bacterium]|nr:tyrosine-type recombinase/integrase [Nitrospinota bacterium]